MKNVKDFKWSLTPNTKQHFSKTKKRNYYCLRNPRFLVSSWKFLIADGIGIISFKEPQIWQDLLEEIRKSDSLNFFKSNIKIVKPLLVTATYVKRLFFVWVILINHLIIKSTYCIQNNEILYSESILISNISLENVFEVKEGKINTLIANSIWSAPLRLLLIQLASGKQSLTSCVILNNNIYLRIFLSWYPSCLSDWPSLDFTP